MRGDAFIGVGDVEVHACSSLEVFACLLCGEAHSCGGLAGGDGIVVDDVLDDVFFGGQFAFGLIFFDVVSGALLLDVSGHGVVCPREECFVVFPVLRDVEGGDGRVFERYFFSGLGYPVAFAAIGAKGFDLDEEP